MTGISIRSIDFDIMDQLLCISQILEKNSRTMGQYIGCLYRLEEGLWFTQGQSIVQHSH
jgi:hypothetical protein